MLYYHLIPCLRVYLVYLLGYPTMNNWTVLAKTSYSNTIFLAPIASRYMWDNLCIHLNAQRVHTTFLGGRQIQQSRQVKGIVATPHYFVQCFFVQCLHNNKNAPGEYGCWKGRVRLMIQTPLFLISAWKHMNSLFLHALYLVLNLAIRLCLSVAIFFKRTHLLIRFNLPSL